MPPLADPAKPSLPQFRGQGTGTKTFLEEGGGACVESVPVGEGDRVGLAGLRVFGPREDWGWREGHCPRQK